VVRAAGVPHFIEHYDASEHIWREPSTSRPAASRRRSPWSRRERANVALVGLFARAVQIAAVAAGVWLFLVTFGALAMTEHSTANWVGGEVNVLLSWSLDQRQMVVTEELLRVAGFLATFTGLSFTVYLVTDPTYRAEFRTDVASELREVFAVRAAYRWALHPEPLPVALDPSR
jgi:hypothetical protein